jgi:Phycobilisome degradation protein nblA
MDNLALELSLEQQFSLRKYESQVKELSQTQSQEFLLEALRQLMVKDNAIRSLVKSDMDLRSNQSALN